MLTRRLQLLLVCVLLITSCTQSNSNLSNTNPPTPSGSSTGINVPIALSRPLPNVRVVPSGSPTGTCPPISFDLIGQAITGGTATLFLGDPGPTEELVAGERRANVTIPDGTTYTGTVNPLTMSVAIPSTCVATSVTFPISASFGVNYLSVIENDPGDPEICVFRSRADFTSFTVTVTGTPMDAALRELAYEEVRNQIHKFLDFQVADGISRRLRSRPLPGGNDGRCGEWLRLTPGGGINR